MRNADWRPKPKKHDLSISNNYFFAGAGALAGAFFAGALAAGAFALTAAGGAAFAFAFAGAAAFAFASAGFAVFALASAGAVFAFASTVFEFAFAVVAPVGASGLLDKTETFPVSAGIAKNNADNMNVVAAMIVILDKTVAVPRGANAELDTLLVKSEWRSCPFTIYDLRFTSSYN